VIPVWSELQIKKTGGGRRDARGIAAPAAADLTSPCCSLWMRLAVITGIRNHCTSFCRLPHPDSLYA
jgi:hypothetical protein